MAQDVVGRQRFRLGPSQRLSDCGSGCLRIGQFLALGVTTRVSLQLGHFASMRSPPLSLLIPSEIPLGSFEILCKKLAISLRDSDEFYAHTKTRGTLGSTDNCRPDDLRNNVNCLVIGWVDDHPKISLQRRRFAKRDERTNWTNIFNPTLNLGLRSKYSSGPTDHASAISTSFLEPKHSRSSSALSRFGMFGRIPMSYPNSGALGTTCT